MALYLIAFNDEWVPDLTLEELRERGTAGKAVIEEMTAAGVFVFSDGGLDASTAVCSVDPSSGSPVFTDGPFVETKEHLGGFAVVDVPDDAEARYWAGRIAVAVGWPQEVHRFPRRIGFRAGCHRSALGFPRQACGAARRSTVPCRSAPASGLISPCGRRKCYRKCAVAAERSAVG